MKEMFEGLIRLYETPALLPSSVPPTPATGTPEPCQDIPWLNDALLAIAEVHGYTAMTTSEKGGRRVHDIIPIQGREAAFSNEGSHEFPWHVEVPQLFAERPDAVLFYCIRGHSNAATSFAVLGDCFEKLPLWCKSALREEVFSLQVSPSYAKREELWFGAIKPIRFAFAVHTKNLITFDQVETKTSNTQALKALDEFAQMLERQKQTIALKAGDLVIFDNIHLAHKREEWGEPPIYNGSQRWLKRIYLKKKPSYNV
jgi:hypothetical protein